MPKEDDLAGRMAALRRPARPAKVDTREPSSSNAAFRKAGKPYPHKVTLELDEAQYRALRLATVEDGLPVSERLRGLIAQWITTQ